MKRTRRNHSAVFKAKVALAARKGDKTRVDTVLTVKEQESRRSERVVDV